jgi:hypothetical protein
MRAVLLAAVLVLACCAAEASCSLGAPARHPCGVEALFLAGTSYAPLPYSSCCNSLRLVARRLYCCCVTSAAGAAVRACKTTGVCDLHEAAHGL